MAAASRETWSSRLGFTLAAVGSAVGLGNMWRFSYMTAENGGAAFVVLYVLMTALVGVPVLLAELVIGRGAARGPVHALVHFGGRRWRSVGALFVLAGAVILAYYGVIAGWTLRYAAEALIVGFPSDAGAHFEGLASGLPAVLWHLVFMALTIAVVSGGVSRGIERASLLLMPLLALIVVGLAVYAATLAGAGAGYDYYFTTNFAEIADLDVLADAASQAFFSLSLGMGAILTYASYLSGRHDLPREAVTIAVSDFSVAFLAGLVVFPLLFALGLEADVIGQGTGTVGALFVVLPKAFAQMGTPGVVLGAAFFVALFVGALTSGISLLEVVVATTMDGLGMARRRAAWWCGGAIALLGVPPALSIGVLGLMDALAGNLFLILGGLLLALFVGFQMKDAPEEAVRGSRPGGWVFLWRGLLRWVVPAVLAVVLWFSAAGVWRAFVGLLG